MTAVASSPPPAKLRTVLDYVPCDACLAEHSPEQELLCSVCRRLDRTVTVKRTERRTFIVVRPAPPPPPALIPPAAPPPREPEPERAPEPEPEPAAPEQLPAQAEAPAEPAEAPAPPMEPSRPSFPRHVLVLTPESIAQGERAALGAIEVVIEEAEPPRAAPAPAPAVALAPAPEAEAAPEPEPTPQLEDLEPEFAAVAAEVASEGEDDFDSGFDLTNAGPPQDAFEWVKRPEGADAAEAARDDAEPEDFSEEAFVFTPSRRDEAEAEPAEAELAAEDEPEFEPVEEGRSPWARPAEDDWLLEAPPEAGPEREEPWPDEAASEAAPEAPLEALPESEEIIETLEVVEDEPVEEEVYETTVVEEPVEPAPAAPANGLDGFSDVRPADAQRLAEAGVTRPADLSGRDPWQLADQTGLSAKRLEKWIWTAELMSVAGVPLAHADLLVRSGVRGLDGLRAADAEQAARDVNALLSADERHASLPPVSADDVAQWKRRA